MVRAAFAHGIRQVANIALPNRVVRVVVSAYFTPILGTAAKGAFGKNDDLTGMVKPLMNDA